jgi:heme exporter protein A
VPAIEVEGLHFSFGAVHAVRGVSIEVERGTVLTIFGPNGAGKTTFLKVLAGLLRQSEGTVRIEGVEARRDAAGLRRLIGVISHHPYLYPQLTGRENLEFYGRMYGLKDPRSAALRMLEDMGLTSVGDREVSAYSRGMQQRLAVARALLHQPRVLLLDEPFTGLDHQARERLEALLGTLRDGEKTVVMTTHDIDEGLSLSDRVMVLSAGRKVLDAAAPGLDRASFLAQYRDAVA